MPEAKRTYAFPRTHRLRSRADFSAVFESGSRRPAGPLVVFSRPNELGHSRMGISISRNVRTAAKRNRIKRLLRESFRLMQHEFPRGYDWIVVVRPHQPLKLEEYQKLVGESIARLRT
jgi:ribonuclease P protein component